MNALRVGGLVLLSSLVACGELGQHDPDTHDSVSPELRRESPAPLRTHPLGVPASFGFDACDDAGTCVEEGFGMVAFSPDALFIGPETAYAIAEQDLEDELLIERSEGVLPLRVGQVLLIATSPVDVLGRIVSIRDVEPNLQRVWLREVLQMDDYIDELELDVEISSLDTLELREEDLWRDQRPSLPNAMMMSTTPPELVLDRPNAQAYFRAPFARLPGGEVRIGLRDLSFTAIKDSLKSLRLRYMFHSDNALIPTLTNDSFSDVERGREIAAGVKVLVGLTGSYDIGLTPFGEIVTSTGVVRTPSGTIFTSEDNFATLLELGSNLFSSPSVCWKVLCLEVGADFRATFQVGGELALSIPIRLTGTIEPTLRYSPSKPPAQRLSYSGSPNHQPRASLNISLSGSVSADLGIYPYAKVHIPRRADKDYVKLGVGGGIAVNGKVLGGFQGTSAVGALSWAFNVFASGLGEYRVQSAELFTSASTAFSVDFLRKTFFINCGQCATWLDGCKALCSAGAATCDNVCECLPDCREKSCGEDGCGGLCGLCDATDEQCSPISGGGAECTCRPRHVPGTCRDGCGGFRDWACADAQRCDRDSGLCVPRCGPNACGPDGSGYDCGGCDEGANEACVDSLCIECTGCEDSCGGVDACGRPCDCPEGRECLDARCVEACPTQCPAWASCDGGQCVPCPDGCGTEEFCVEGECVGCPQSCGTDAYCDRGECVPCQGGCGLQAYCLDGTCAQCASTCAPGDRCVEGSCEECPCVRGDGVVLECGTNECGGPCGPLSGQCPWDANCVDGLCEPCQPDCDGRECGGDGCGGLCMGKDLECPAFGVCEFETGQCAPCPSEQNCLGKSCGPDGCGGTCGACDATIGQFCTADQQCAGAEPADSCAARPDGERCCVLDAGDTGELSDCTSPAGRCFCDDKCLDFDDCCLDYEALCGPPANGGAP